MTLEEFARIIERPLTLQFVPGVPTSYWRCFFDNTSVVGCGPNQERARRDLVQKIRGRNIGFWTPTGRNYREYAVPDALTA